MAIRKHLRQQESLVSFLCFQVAEEISKVQGVKKVLVAQHDSYKGALPGMVDALYLLAQQICI